jgi:hypothetical protein
MTSALLVPVTEKATQATMLVMGHPAIVLFLGLPALMLFLGFPKLMLFLRFLMQNGSRVVRHLQTSN